MKFAITDRTLMKMLFERGTVSEISGVCKVGRYERRWEVIFRPVTIFRAEAYYEASVSGIYDQTATGDTLDECLDKLEAIIEEAAA